MNPTKGDAPAIGPAEASVKTTPATKQEESSMTNSTDASVVAQVTPETLPAITWKQARVVTTELLARLYSADNKQIHDNFQNNQARFEAGKHFYRLVGEELKHFKNYPELNGLVAKHSRQVILWTERGAARHAKMLETNAAWQVFEKLEDCYFGEKSVVEVTYSVAPSQTLSAAEADTLRGLLTSFAESMPKDLRAQIMIQGWSKLKAHFKADYRHIPASQFTEAVSILGRHIAYWAPTDPKKTLIGMTAAPAVDHTPTLRGRRWVINMDWEGKEFVTPVPDGAMIYTWDQILRRVSTNDDLPNGFLLEVANAAMTALYQAGQQTKKTPVLGGPVLRA